MDISIIKVDLPEYDLKTQPDYIKVGQKVDKEIEYTLTNGQYICRAIGKDDHPQLTLDELVKIIAGTGTDKYDAERKEVCFEEFSMYDHDFQAGLFEIKNHKIVIGTSNEQKSFFGDIVKKFYENVLWDRGYRVRIDLLIIYDPKQLSKAQKVDATKEGVPPYLEEFLYKFNDPENKKEALVAIVKIHR